MEQSDWIIVEAIPQPPQPTQDEPTWIQLVYILIKRVLEI